MSGEASPEISLMMSAPARRASRATSGLRVSMEMRALGKLCLMAEITGMVRRISVWMGTGEEPGRADSPPMSMM